MAASLHSPGAAYGIAILGSLAYGLMVLVSTQGWIPVRAGPFVVPVADAWPFTTVLFNALASLAIAVIASSLSQVARQALVSSRRLEAELEQLNRALEQRIGLALRDLQTKNEALERSVERMETYARAISHDLRNPLTAAGESVRIAAGVDAAAGRRYLGLATENLLKADRMLVGLRDLMRTRGEEPAAEPVDVRSLLETVIQDLSGTWARGRLPIRIDGRLPVVSVNPEQLALVFRNLLQNALEHNADVPDLVVEVGAEDDAGQPAFFVRDNGSGIAPELHDRLFHPFYSGRADREDGLGLGLSLVEAIVTQASGRVWVESKPGQGAVFRFTFPDAATTRRALC